MTHGWAARKRGRCESSEVRFKRGKLLERQQRTALVLGWCFLWLLFLAY